MASGTEAALDLAVYQGLDARIEAADELGPGRFITPTRGLEQFRQGCHRGDYPVVGQEEGGIHAPWDRQGPAAAEADPGIPALRA
jgi:hypothetical protein